MVLMALSTRVFFPHDLVIQDFPVHDDDMRVAACGGIFFPLLQHVQDLLHGIKVQDLDKVTRFDLVLSSLAVQCLEESNWTIDGCFGYYHYPYWTGMVRGVPSYR